MGFQVEEDVFFGLEAPSRHFGHPGLLLNTFDFSVFARRKLWR